MLIIHGRRNANIKSFKDYQQTCSDCKDFGLEITISQEYYHLYYIPFAPVGNKVVYMRCLHCGAPVRNYVQEQTHADQARTPFYYYSVPLGVVALILFAFIASLFGQKQKAERAAHPQAGDVYLIRDDSNLSAQYYFLKVISVTNDSVMVYHNHISYTAYMSDPRPGDYFVTEDTLYYSRRDIIKMQEDDIINTVKRAH